MADLKKYNRRFLEDPDFRDSLIYSRAWEKALDDGLEATVSLTLEKTEWGQVMRSCSPFAVITDQKWRAGFLRDWRERYDTPEKIAQHELFAREG